MKVLKLKPKKKLLLAAGIGFLIGCMWLLAIRFTLLSKHQVHYHANFAFYVNGTQDLFDNFTFYEEVQVCSGDELNNPKTRVHMHDGVSHVVHVHDNAVTWGHFFANIGYALGDVVLKTDDGVFVSGDGEKRLSFVLNGKVVETIANRVIHSSDILLVNYGDESKTELDTRFAMIKNDATVYNQKNDPSSCTGSKPFTIKERLYKTFRIDQ